MNFKRTLLALTTLTLAASVAQAAPGDVGAGSYGINNGGTTANPTATVGQTITVTVPKRFGLHLHRSSWNLDLAFLNANGTYTGVEGAPTGTSASDAKCVRAGDHSSTSGRDYLYQVGTSTDKNTKILSLLNGATYEGDQVADTAGNAYSYTGVLSWPAPSNARSGSGTSETFALGTAGTTGTGAGGTINQPIGGYPGFYTTTGEGSSSLVWKGPIMCSFQTIVQKFSNSSSGFNFTAKLTPGTNSTFPLPLYVRDFIKGPAITGISTSSVVLSTTATTLAAGTANTLTGGWLDDHLLQVLVFDGTETNGNYVGNVTYTLSDPTPPTN